MNVYQMKINSSKIMKDTEYPVNWSGVYTGKENPIKWSKIHIKELREVFLTYLKLKDTDMFLISKHYITSLKKLVSQKHEIGDWYNTINAYDKTFLKTYNTDEMKCAKLFACIYVAKDEDLDETFQWFHYHIVELLVDI